MSTSKITSYTTSSEQLKEIALLAAELGVVALDTEFVWERTFYPNLGIVQLALPNGFSTIIDTTIIEDCSALGDILEDEKIVKILHDSTQDLTILYNLTGAYPKNIFDTQRAAGFMGLPCTISLANLLKESVGIELAKTETRTNWLKRPLSEKQIEYALDDVKYLEKTREVILNAITSTTVLRWLEMDMKELENRELYHTIDPSNAYLKIKGRNRLRGHELAILQNLAEWRELKARDRNIPREFVITNKQLLTIAKIDKFSTQNLLKNSELNDRKVKRNIDSIIKICTKDIDPATYPKSPKKVTKSTSIRVKKITDKVLLKIKERSASAGIDYALVFSRAKIGGLISNPKNRVMGWRAELIGDVINDAKL